MNGKEIQSSKEAFSTWIPRLFHYFQSLSPDKKLSCCGRYLLLEKDQAVMFFTFEQLASNRIRLCEYAHGYETSVTTNWLLLY